MEQWNGLLKKEWFLMKEWFWATIGIAVFSIFLLPYGISLFLQEENVAEVALGAGMFWIIIGIIVPTIILLNSIGKEMQHPDIWLHSTASMHKILSVKMSFAAFIGLINLVLSISTTFIRLSGGGLTLSNMMQLGWTLILSFFIASICIMCVGLLFGAIFQVIKPVVKGFSWPIILLLLLVAGWAMERISRSTLYQKIGEIGPKIGINSENTTFNEGSLTMEIEALELRTGDLFMDIIFAALLFFVASFLLEKKVRL